MNTRKMDKRGAHAALAGALLALLCGCPSAGQVKDDGAAVLKAADLPSDPQKLLQIADEQFDHGGGGVSNAVTALRQALDKNPEWATSKDSYPAHWRLTRAYADLCGDSSDDAKIATLAQEGVAAGRKAVALAPDQVEGHYYLAAVLGYQAKTQKGESKDIVNELLREAERADQIDPKYDHGGPARVLGAIYTRAPAPPISVGDPDKAVKQLQRAVQLDGDFPANSLYLAGALVADERYDEAEKQLQRTRELMQKGGFGRYRDLWNTELKRVEAKLRARG